MRCEKCWDSAYIRSRLDPTKTQTGHYYDLLKEWKDSPFHDHQLHDQQPTPVHHKGDSE